MAQSRSTIAFVVGELVRQCLAGSLRLATDDVHDAPGLRRCAAAERDRSVGRHRHLRPSTGPHAVSLRVEHSAGGVSEIGSSAEQRDCAWSKQHGGDRGGPNGESLSGPRRGSLSRQKPCQTLHLQHSSPCSHSSRRSPQTRWPRTTQLPFLRRALIRAQLTQHFADRGHRRKARAQKLPTAVHTFEEGLSCSTSMQERRLCKWSMQS